ncbi:MULTISPECIES: hypothetical protein [unclassified Streptomyces]|uniref:hypothetical protein n=1 Tax=unclassified Streptomyces TaxID=2593676 RepID=UPI00081D6F78|nr:MULTISPECIES: hypothetical protein [unclassified Streptomyces]MYZ34892.1 hypothetical protein [Streptomyces sp. SID4917]SCF71162.1 hypothetical protein GA0115259_1013817 [Streptomyces sp. MnatMP-M17]
MRTAATASRRSSAVRHPARAVPGARRRRPRHGDIAVDTATGLLVDLRQAPDSVRVLPRGQASGRYSCLACGRTLELCGPRDHTDFTARFRHTRHEIDRCPATPGYLARVRAAVTDTQALAERLAAAAPGVRIQAAMTATAEPKVMPVLALRLEAPSGAGVIHLPHGELSDHQADRILANRNTATRQWVLFDRHDGAHYRAAGQVQVRTRRQDQRIDKISPTSGQQRLAQAQFAVAWRDDGTLLLPFGGHPITYPPRATEDWSGSAASWQRDWKISHPRPADGAAWWGLLPLPLRALAAPALLGAAVTAMTDLEAAQSGREAYRRGKARERYAQQARLTTARPRQLALPLPADTAASPDSTISAADQTPQSPAAAAPAPDPETAAHEGRPRRWRRWRRLLARLRHR